MLTAATLRAIFFAAIVIWAWLPLLRDESIDANPRRALHSLHRKLKRAVGATLIVVVLAAGAQIAHDIPIQPSETGPGLF